MVKIITIFLVFMSIFVIQSIGFASKERLRKESEYQEEWCGEKGGVTEYVLADNTRIDCLTDVYAIEFDFADKWAEAIGQSLHYALMSGKKPGIVLIIEHQKDEKHLNKLMPIALKYDIMVWVIKVPVPDIKANNSDTSITIGTSDTLSIDISLSAGSNASTNCDWWVVESAPDGWYYYSLTTSWTSAESVNGLKPTHQGALLDVGSYSVLNTSGLSEGTHTFYFAIDTKMNGSLDTGSIYYDSVEVKVTSE